MIDLLVFPAITCIALVLVHVYFGAFVLKRGVLFIDLALAQWAALGYLLAHACGVENHLLLHGAAFVAALVVGCFLSLIKKLFKETNLLEASIGVIYITGSAISVGLIVSLGLESHLMDEMLGGHLLFVGAEELLFSAFLYAVVFCMLIRFYSYFLKANQLVWDLVFYGCFAVVVASSVKLVGVLLVFSYLVLPVLSLAMMGCSLRQQIIWGWLMGILASGFGMWLSVKSDLPLSYAIVYTMGLFWLMSLCIAVSKFVVSKKQKC